MRGAQRREEGICAAAGLSREPPWGDGSTHTHTHKDGE